jgi:amidohydrolase
MSGSEAPTGIRRTGHEYDRVMSSEDHASESSGPLPVEEGGDPAIATTLEHAGDLLGDAIDLRRRLHERPELGNDLPNTTEQVLGALDGLPLEITLHETTSGVAALLEGSHPGPTILLRGDMDALPMPEDTGVDFSSTVDNVMHACGHDLHTAMLAGAANLLSERRDEIAGRVLFMFQPGEEGHHGAKFMLDEGLLDVPAFSDGTDSPVDAAFALHVTSLLPTGFVSTRGGAVMASADTARIEITGKGGHASSPHFALDPIPVACEIVQSLQTMITRSIDVFDPAVVTVGRIAAGTTSNVIPESATIDATIRTVSERTRSKVHDGIRRVAEGIAAAHGCECEVKINIGYPVTTNDQAYADHSLELASDVVGSDQVFALPNPVMGAEDFSYVLQEVPGAMMFLGATPHDRNPLEAAPNHSNRVYYDEAAMTSGIALYSTAALRHLSANT